MALIAASVLCGSLIGTERERKLKPAGLRTMILICLGSTVFTLISPVLESSSGESGRMAAQIVTGVGFLGAGAILQGSSGVRGLTSAALIWTTAAIGMVIGAGLGGAGLALSVLLRCSVFWPIPILNWTTTINSLASESPKKREKKKTLWRGRWVLYLGVFTEA